MGKTAVAIELKAAERRELVSLTRARKTGQAMARRARIVLSAAAGLENKAICVEVGADANTVSKWRRRFAAHRLDGLLDEPRPGTPRKIGDDEIADTIRRTLEPTRLGPPHGDIVGLYMSPPERALVLCVDEKSQIQALDRSQPLLPMRPGQVERRTHDPKRHGTTSLFAALDVATGAVIGRCYPKHRSNEFRKFLDQIEQAVPADFAVHLVMDNYATHKTKPIRDWLAKRPRWQVHFTPTGASWINQVERFFALLTDKQIRRGVHRSTQALENDIRAFIEAHNAAPKPFRWTKAADDILASIQRFCLRTQQLGGIKESGH